MKENVIEEFRWRGMLQDKTDGIEEVLLSRKVTGYIGFDPTSDSLHVGNLLPIMGLVHLQRHGHRPIALVGGATGMVGDPSGRSKERNLLDEERLAHNVACIRDQLARFLDFDTKANPAQLLNNADWLGKMSFIGFMRDVGKYFPVGYMLAKDSVKRRLEGEGISFTEFSYMLLQAYDFYYLQRNFNCELQLGGSDQWGNITAGTELVRRISEGRVYGLVFPLITSATGEKFGKSLDGAVYLDAKKTSPYKFYQYWINLDDRDVIAYLKYFSLLDEEEIEAIAADHSQAPHKRLAQKRLAEEVTRAVHGPAALAQAVRASQAMFGGQLTDMGAGEIGEIFGNVPSTQLPRARFEGEGVSIIDLFTECGVTKSKGEARRLLKGGGINLNNQRITDMGRLVRLEDAIESSFMVLRQGSKRYHLVKIVV